MYCENCGEKNEEDIQFCIYCGNSLKQGQENTLSSGRAPKKNKKKLNKSVKIFFIILGIILVTSGLAPFITIFFNDSDTETSSKQTTSEINNIKAVVNILCDESGGSGVMLSEDGLILTNHHVVSEEEDCIVTIPDPASGEPVEIYFASPVIFPDLSEQYDIAMLEIYDVYTDEDGESWGSYPNKFTYFQTPDSCTDNPWKLGESIKIYGYPTTSYNYNLTVTEGIISNFDSGYILTSAKVDSGNSGGLALNQEGCMVGIPSAVLTGDHQNLGVITSWDIILEFIDEIDTLVESSDLESIGSQQEQIEKPVSKPTEDITPPPSEDEVNKSSNQWLGTFCPNPVEMIDFTRLEALGGGKVKIEWIPLSHTQSSYSIFHSTAPAGFTLLTSGGSSGTVDIGGLEPNKKHYFLVQFDWYQGPKHVCATSYSRSVLVK